MPVPQPSGMPHPAPRQARRRAAAPPLGLAPRALMAGLREHWGDRHFRNGYYLMMNSVVGAAAGLLFWLLLKLAYAVPDVDIGKGFAAISLATAIALVGKGGLDAALVRHVPRASRKEGLRLLELATSVGFASVAVLVVGLALAVRLLGYRVQDQDITPQAFALVGGLACLLVLTWLQDAHFLAEGEARFSFYRNLVLNVGRLATPALVLAWALPFPIPLAWGLALGLSVGMAWVWIKRLPEHRDGDALPPAIEPAHQRERTLSRAFLRSAARNITGSAAEFLPGLILAPLVYHLEGPTQAAYFGIAWTGASMLFLLSAAISRSTFAEMSRHGRHGLYLRRAAKHHVLIVAPAAVAAMVLSPVMLRLFGQGYAANGEAVFLLLAASIVLIAPVYLYLALLRSREDRGLLVAYPAVLVAALVVAAPWFEARYGLPGVGMAWVVIHTPLAAFAAQRLRHQIHADAAQEAAPQPTVAPVAAVRPPGEEVTHALGDPADQRGAAHLE